MSHKITITVPDDLYKTLVDSAHQFGLTPEEAALQRLSQPIPAKTHALPAEHRPEAEARIERHFGAWDSGDTHSGDNERIDADLAREYAGAREPR